MADYIKNTPVSPLRESNISKYISMMSEVDTVKALLSTQTDTDGASPNQKELNAAYAISDMFQSIAKEGMTVSEILDYMYTNYELKEINEVAKKIKIIHSKEDYNIRAKNSEKILTKDSNFFIKINDSQFGIDNSKEKEKPNKYNIDNLLNIDGKSGINSLPTDPTRLNPNLVSIMHNDPKFRCGVRNSLELSTFWNLLSSIELSKMYPYLNATFKLPRFVSNSNQVFTTATVNQFLNGTIDSANVTENYKIFEAGFVKDQTPKTGNERGQTTVLAGTNTNFSIFTMPQTVNNFNEKFVGHLDNFGKVDTRATTIHDITRPFLTIHSFDIDIAPSQGLLSFKSGRISMTLHDRTRMTDIAPFVKPDLFGSFGAEIVVEYGWSHMDADDDKNYIAQFLNKSRVIEKYIITNSSFSIQKDGSVKIDLGIAMRGPLDIRQVVLKRDPSKGASTDALQSALNALQDKIDSDSSLEKDLFQGINQKSVIKLTSTFRSAVQKVINDASYPTKKQNKKKILLDRFLSFGVKNLDLQIVRPGDNPLEQIAKTNQTKLSKALRTLAEKGVIISNTQIITQIQRMSIENSDLMADLFAELQNYRSLLVNLQSKLAVVRDITKDNESSKDKVVSKIIPSQSHDAYVDKSIINFLNINRNKIYTSKNKKKPLVINKNFKDIAIDKYVSFGSFITSLIGTHMTATGKFEEIQIIFYTANENCGAMSSNNIASFLIEKEKLELFLKNLFREDLQFTLESIIKAVVDNFISVRSQPCYGFSGLFQDKSDASGKKEPVSSEAKELDDNIDVIMANILQLQTDSKEEDFNVEFKMPRIGISFDTLTTKNTGFNRTISKISLFDRNDNPFSSLNQITNNIQKNTGILLLNSKISKLRKEYALTTSGDRDIKPGRKLTKNQIAYFKESGKLIEKFIPKFIEERNGQLIIKNDKNGISSLKSGFKKLMPSTTYGTQNSGIITANVTTVNDGALNTVYLTRPDRNDAGRNYTVGFSKALPLRILPTQATVEIWGCPFINFAQYVFLDFETGTTIDNIYSVASLKHSITPGSFKTTLTLSYGDVYGKYETAARTIEEDARARKAAEEDKKEKKKAAEKKAAKSANKPAAAPAPVPATTTPSPAPAPAPAEAEAEAEAPAPATTTTPAATPSTEESARTPDEVEVKPKPSKPKKLDSSVQFENIFSFSKVANEAFKDKYDDIFIIKFKLNLFLNNGFSNHKNRMGINSYINAIPKLKKIDMFDTPKILYRKTEINSTTKFYIDNKLNDNILPYIQTFYYDKRVGNNDLKENISINNVFQDVNSYILIPIRAYGSITSYLPICVPKQNQNIFKIKQLPLTVSFEYNFENSEITKNSIKNNFYDMNIANNIEAGYDSITIDEIKKSYKNKKALSTWHDYLPKSLIKFEFHLANYSKTIVDPTNNKLSKSFLYCFYYFNSIENLDFFYNQIKTNFEIKNLTLNDRDFQSKESKYIVKEYDYEKNKIPVNILKHYDVKMGSDTEYLEYFNNLTNYVTKDIKEKRIIVIFDMNVIIDKHIKSLSTPVEIDKTIK